MSETIIIAETIPHKETNCDLSLDQTILELVHNAGTLIFKYISMHYPLDYEKDERGK